MAETSKNNVKVKALSFIDKVSDFLNKGKDLSVPDSENSSPPLKENFKQKQKPESLSEKKNILHEASAKTNNGFENKLRASIIDKLVYDPQTDSFAIPEELILTTPVAKQPAGTTDREELNLKSSNNPSQTGESSNKLKKLLTSTQMQNIVKMKADNFKDKITDHGIRKVSKDETIEYQAKDHRIFINSKIARDLGLYQKFYQEKNVDISSAQITSKPGPAKKIAGARPDVHELPLPGKLKYNPDTDGFSVSAKIPEKLSFSKPFSKNDNYIDSEKQELLNKLLIFEEGIFVGIKVNETTRSQVIDTMKPFSKTRFDIGCKDSVLNYEDIGLVIHFNEKGIVCDLEFNSKFPGTTAKGLKIGDTFEKAISFYGPPGICTDKKAIWRNMQLISNGFYIVSIKLARSNYYIDSEKALLSVNFNIYTTGIMIGIVVGQSTNSIIAGGHNKDHVIQFMKNYSAAEIEPDYEQPVFHFKDIDISVGFDEADIVNTMEFGKNFLGSTIKGLKVGETVEKALKLYGEPDLYNDDIINWNKFKLYHRDKIITSFKIHR